MRALSTEQACADWLRVCAVAAPLMHQNSLLTLQGAGAYDAAVHCASVSAARRIMSHRGDTPTHAGSSMRGPFDPQHPFTPRAVRLTAVCELKISAGADFLLKEQGNAPATPSGCLVDARGLVDVA